jgi:hypothetical protein
MVQMLVVVRRFSFEDIRGAHDLYTQRPSTQHPALPKAF